MAVQATYINMALIDINMASGCSRHWSSVVTQAMDCPGCTRTTDPQMVLSGTMGPLWFFKEIQFRK